MTDVAEALDARSWLFAPGDSERKAEKAVASAADLVLLDLEDAVAEAQKPRARSLVAALLGARAGERRRLWVRINPLQGAHALADLTAVLPGRPGGILLPKCRGRADVERLAHYLCALESAFGIEAGSTAIAALVTETAGAMFTAADYAGAPRLAALTCGAEDLADAIGASVNRDEQGRYGFTFELARTLCLLGAASAGVSAIETIHADFRDEPGLRQRAQEARRAGFRGMLAIHPAQIPLINEAFTPSAAEVAAAQEIVALFAAHPGAGAIGHQGAMLDRPHLARAQRLLRLAATRAQR